MKENKAIQNRIDDEITVDCYEDWEVNDAWAIYLSENLNFPFQADAPVKKRGKRPTYQRVDIVELASTEGNYRGGSFYVGMDIQGMVVPVDLLALQNVKADKGTLQAIGDWAYWNGKG